MKEKITEKFNDINKDATVGSTKRRIFKIDFPVIKSSISEKRASNRVTIKPSIKRENRKSGCSGCSRKRKIG